MIRTSHDAPETPRPVDWRHAAACRDTNVNPELFFPTGNTGPALLQIEEAKAVCRRCPVMDQCLQWALETRQHSGIWGGLSEDERGSRRRRKTRQQRTRPLPRRQPQPAPKTLAEAFVRRTQRTADGHLLWYGAQQMKFQNIKYTALQAAFIVSHGREPDGPVRRMCGKDCYRGDHLTDGVIRERRTGATKKVAV